MRLALGYATLLAVAAGCGQSSGVDPSASTAQPQLSHVTFRPQPASAAATDIEEFEGLVELFGQRLRARREVKLDDNGNYVKHGKAVAWYESGQKAGEMWFRDNLPHGPIRVWHENGFKRQRGQSNGGLAFGVWTEWYDNGQLQSEGEFVEGERNGEWTTWDETGRVVESAEYRDGQKLRTVSRQGAAMR